MNTRSLGAWLGTATLAAAFSAPRSPTPARAPGPDASCPTADSSVAIAQAARLVAARTESEERTAYRALERLGPSALCAAPLLVAALSIEDTGEVSMKDAGILGILYKMDRSGRVVVPLLVQRIQQPSAPQECRDCVLALIFWQEAAASVSPVLLRLMMQANWRRGDAEIGVLERIGVDSVPESLSLAARDTFFRRASSDSGTGNRLLAARALALFGARARDALVLLTASPDTAIVIEAAQALAVIVRTAPTSQVFAPMSRRLGDPSEGVRRAAQSLLVEMGPSALGMLDSIGSEATPPARDLARLAAREIRTVVRLTDACFAIRSPQWTRRDVNGPTARGTDVPDAIRFTRVPSRWYLGSGSMRWQLTAANGAREASRGPGSWSVDREHPDSLFISWSNGFTGAGVHAAVSGDTISGRLSTFVDVSPSVDDVAGFLAHRVVCTLY